MQQIIQPLVLKAQGWRLLFLKIKILMALATKKTNINKCMFTGNNFLAKKMIFLELYRKNTVKCQSFIKKYL